MNFASLVLEQNGIIKPLIIDSKLTNGTGVFNPSIFVDQDRLYINIRCSQYTLYHSEQSIHQHPYGPLLYLNPENDITLTTYNYIGELDNDLSFKYYNKVDTSKFDKNPIWEFVGLEDARLFKWDNRFYICGVRRDTTPNGQGRMELSEVAFSQNHATEISRYRIPAPAPDISYCEKNWMPILDNPYHFVKWSNPVEVVRVDPENKTTETVFLSKNCFFARDQRGGGQVIPFDQGYLSLTHEVDLFFNVQGKKNAVYRHRFILWDQNWNPIKKSADFSFMGAKIEFACGLAEYKDNILVTFGFQDNAAYILKCSKDTIRDFMNA